MFKMSDKLDELREYDWGKAIVEYLTNYLNSKDAKDVKGCTAFLQVPILLLLIEISLH